MNTPMGMDYATTLETMERLNKVLSLIGKWDGKQYADDIPELRVLSIDINHYADYVPQVIVWMTDNPDLYNDIMGIASYFPGEDIETVTCDVSDYDGEDTPCEWRQTVRVYGVNVVAYASFPIDSKTVKTKITADRLCDMCSGELDCYHCPVNTWLYDNP